MIRIEIRANPTNPQRAVVEVLAEGSERLMLVDAPRDVALAALSEYLRGLTLRRISQ